MFTVIAYRDETSGIWLRVFRRPQGYSYAHESYESQESHESRESQIHTQLPEDSTTLGTS